MLTGKSGSVSCGVTAPFSWVLVNTRFCLCPPRVCFPVLQEFCNQIPLAFKVTFPGGSQSFCWIPRLGNLLWALELSQQCESFFGIIVLQFVGRLLGHSKVGLMATLSKRTYATRHTSQVCCSQSPCPHSRPLLTCASTGDTQTLRGRPGSVSCGVPGSCCKQGFFEPSTCLWWVWGLTGNMISPLPQSCWGFSFLPACMSEH